MSSQPAAEELKRMIEDVRQMDDPSCGLVLEHLQAAHTYLLGAMPVEYNLSLAQAHDALSLLKDGELKDRVTAMLEDLQLPNERHEP